MRRHTALIAFTTVIATTALMAPPASAITNGEIDGDRHPNVGVVGCTTSEGDFPIYPSVQLISPTVALTAGHVTGGFSSPDLVGCLSVFVSFDSTFDPETSKRLAVTEIVTHPRFNPNNATNDVGVLILKKPVRGIAPVELPTEGLLDELKLAGAIRDERFVAVGYGADVDCSVHPCSLSFDWIRKFATESYSGLDPTFIGFQFNNTATGEGGSCFGDSGGANFLGDSNLSVGVTNWTAPAQGNSCGAYGTAQRLDTPSVRSFLGRYVRLP